MTAIRPSVPQGYSESEAPCSDDTACIYRRGFEVLDEALGALKPIVCPGPTPRPSLDRIGIGSALIRAVFCDCCDPADMTFNSFPPPRGRKTVRHIKGCYGRIAPLVLSYRFPV
jgi:hypothetical protein